MTATHSYVDDDVVKTILPLDPPVQSETSDNPCQCVNMVYDYEP